MKGIIKSTHARRSSFFGVRVTRSLVLCIMFCSSLFVLLFFFLLAIVLSVLLLTMYCLSFDLWFLITPLVSSNLSCNSIGHILIKLCFLITFFTIYQIQLNLSQTGEQYFFQIHDLNLSFTCSNVSAASSYGVYYLSVDTTFQQRLSLIEDCCEQGSYLTKGSQWSS